MTTTTIEEIIKHLDSKPYLDRRIKQLAENISFLKEEKDMLENIRSYVNQVTDVIDDIPISCHETHLRIEARTVNPSNKDYRWGHLYKRYDKDSYGVCINGKGGHLGGGDNLYQGDHLIGFYESKEKAREVLLNWVVRGKIANEK